MTIAAVLALVATGTAYLTPARHVLVIGELLPDAARTVAVLRALDDGLVRVDPLGMLSLTDTGERRRPQHVSVHVIGRCPVKGCRSRRRHTVDGRITGDRLHTYTSWGVPTEDGAMSPAPIYHGPNIPVSRHPIDRDSDRVWVEAMFNMGWVCETHDRFMRLNAVRGVVNIDRGCNGRCEAATGGDCECACGGENHGAAYA